MFPQYLANPGASLVAQMVKNMPANAGDLGLTHGSGRSPGEGNGHIPRSPGEENGHTL